MRGEVSDWLEEAKVDLNRARRALDDGDYSLSCYMSQQTVEKALKAVMIGLKRERPPHFHDLSALYEGIRDLVSVPNAVVEALPEVSQYYVTARYPNAGVRRPSKSFSRLQAVRALEVAGDVLGRVEEAIPSG